MVVMVALLCLLSVDGQPGSEAETGGSGVETPSAKTVAVTIDDLPFVSGIEGGEGKGIEATHAVSSNRKLLAVLAGHQVPVTGLVNQLGVEGLGEAGPGILRDWIARGFDLGNHTYSHPDFDELTLAQFEDEIVRGESGFLPLMQAAKRSSKFFRFPFNHTGDTKEKHDAAEAFLKARGYRTAPCTIETEDWLFNATYARAHLKKDEATAARVRRDYLTFAAAEIDYFTRLNKEVLGYEPPHILLIHDNPLNADVMAELLGLFEKRGYQFVSLTEAEADPVYRAPETTVTSYGPMWAYRWARERGVKVDGSLEPEAPEWMKTYAMNRALEVVKPRRARTAF